MLLEALAVLSVILLMVIIALIVVLSWSIRAVEEKISDIKSELRGIKYDADRIKENTDYTKDCLIGKSYAFDNLCKKVDDINIKTHIKFQQKNFFKTRCNCEKFGV